MIKENVSGSPFISHICNDIVDLLQEYDRIKKGKDVWGEWRKISNQEYYKKCVIEKIKKNKKWDDLEQSYKRELLTNYISPFQASEKELDRLILELDSLN